MNNLKTEIKNFVIYDNEITKLNKRLKDLKERRERSENNVIQLMKRNNMDNNQIKISDGTLRICNSKRTTPITKEDIKTKLGRFIKNSSEVERVMDYIYNNDRKVVFKECLKRTKK